MKILTISFPIHFLNAISREIQISTFQVKKSTSPKSEPLKNYAR